MANNGFQASQSTGYVTTPSGSRLALSNGFGIALGLVPGFTKIGGFGYNPNVTGSGQDIWSGGGAYTFLTVASQLEILSSSASDTAAGTGARTVTISGLDANYNPLVQLVTLNGTSAVAVPGTFLRVNDMILTTAGSAATNVGNITLRVVSGGATQAYMLASAGRHQSSIFTVPANNQLLVESITFCINNSSASGAYANAALFVYDPVASIKVQRIQLTQQDIDPFTLEIPSPVLVKEKQTFMITSLGVSSPLSYTSTWLGYQVANTAIL